MIFKFQNRLQRHVCFLIHASIIPALYSNLSRALIRNVSVVLLLCVTLGVINLAPFSPFSRHMPYKLMRFHSLYFCILLYASCNYLIRIAKTFERKNELMGDFHSLLSTIFETRGYYKLRCITVTIHYKKATWKFQLDTLSLLMTRRSGTCIAMHIAFMCESYT